MKTILTIALLTLSLNVFADEDESEDTGTDYYSQQMSSYQSRQSQLKNDMAIENRNAINVYSNPYATPERTSNEAENINNMYRFKQRTQ